MQPFDTELHLPAVASTTPLFVKFSIWAFHHNTKQQSARASSCSCNVAASRLFPMPRKLIPSTYYPVGDFPPSLCCISLQHHQAPIKSPRLLSSKPRLVCTSMVHLCCALSTNPTSSCIGDFFSKVIHEWDLEE